MLRSVACSVEPGAMGTVHPRRVEASGPVREQPREGGPRVRGPAALTAAPMPKVERRRQLAHALRREGGAVANVAEVDLDPQLADVDVVAQRRREVHPAHLHLEQPAARRRLRASRGRRGRRRPQTERAQGLNGHQGHPQLTRRALAPLQRDGCGGEVAALLEEPPEIQEALADLRRLAAAVRGLELEVHIGLLLLRRRLHGLAEGGLLGGPGRDRHAGPMAEVQGRRRLTQPLRGELRAVAEADEVDLHPQLVHIRARAQRGRQLQRADLDADG